MTDGAIDWGSISRLAFAYADGELDDGVDNNGNGLADEGVITLTRRVGEAEEATVTLCRHVGELFPGETLNGADDNGNGVTDEPGFNAHLVGNVLELRIALVDVDPDGRPLGRTVNTSVRLRN
ncbi:MAG: hypothetical protein AB1726_00330 [Planctomycetota bacterium]